MAVRVGRKDYVGQRDNRVSENIEMGVTGFSLVADMYVEILGGDTPVGRPRLASAGCEETVSDRVALTLALRDFLALEPVTSVLVGDLTVRQFAGFVGEV